MNIQLVIIDPQRDFCQPANPTLAKAMLAANNNVMTPDIQFVRDGGALYVQGAYEDMLRMSNMVDRLIKKIDAIRVTLDSHHDNDIAHPIFWKDSNGNHPPFFTIISVEDVEKGKWTPTINSARQTGLDYVRALRTNNRYPLCIWPPHCIIGTPGNTIIQPLASSITKWATTRMRYVDYVTKGSNPFTEHYSAVKADVEDPKDETTRLNTDFISAIQKADIVIVAGEALSHCVANSVFDICENFGEENIKKIVLLEDCSSSVGGFEQQGKDFISAMTKRGMRISKSTEFLA